jgi:chorismate mutase
LKIAHELKDSDVSVLEQAGNQERVQEDLKVLVKWIEWLKKAKEQTGLLMGTQ